MKERRHNIMVQSSVKSTRALWRGILKFSGYEVPLKYYTAVREERTRFHLLHDKDKVRLEQRLTCSMENKQVETDEITRGFEVSPGEFVVLLPNEIDAVEPVSDRVISVLNFVDLAEIDPRYFERTYYLGPDGDESKYGALHSAITKTGLGAVCEWVMRNRSYFGALTMSENTLCMITLRADEEVLSTDVIKIKPTKITRVELDTAVSLIGA